MDESQPLLKSGPKRETRVRFSTPNNNNSENQNDEDTSFSNNYLTRLEKITYGLGHIYNDLCAAMWFSYTLLFLQAVLELESTTAGSMMLLGQIMDALATPIIGYLADRWSSKRVWHLIGSAFVFFSFPLIFSRCLGCWMSSKGTYLRWWQPLYYALVITIFQCGWAIVQISHLAMIPMLTQNSNERSELTAIRYTASVCSGVTVYLATWTVLHIESGNNETSIGPTDDYKFRNISLFLTVIGCILTIFFHFGLRKKIDIKNGHSENSSTILNKNKKTMENGSVTSNIKNLETRTTNNSFLRSPLLYQAALLYVAARLFNALALVYMPLYLDERLTSSDSTETVEAIASVPLASYISSFFTSILLKYRNKYINNMLLYVIGSIISIGTCIWIATLLTPSSGTIQLYMVAALLGMGSSITMVTSLCITADLIGERSNQSAVVYSIVTFADKLITGVAVVTIENYKCENRTECPEYYKGILAYVCGGSAALGAITIILAGIVKSSYCTIRRRR